MPGQCRYGVLQYVLVKPTCALITFVSGAAGIYGSHTFSLARLHFYVFFVSSTSQVPRSSQVLRYLEVSPTSLRRVERGKFVRAKERKFKSF